MSPSATLFESGSRTRGRGPFLSRQERSQRNASPDGATTPSRTRFCRTVTRQHVLVLASDARDPSPRPFGLAGKACAAWARHTGPNTSFAKPWWLSRPVGERASRKAEVEPEGCARDRAPPEANRDARHRQSRRAFRGKMALVTFPERKVTRGCRGRSIPLTFTLRTSSADN